MRYKLEILTESGSRVLLAFRKDLKGLSSFTDYMDHLPQIHRRLTFSLHQARYVKKHIGCYRDHTIYKPVAELQSKIRIKHV